jgi:hypothetical protein
MYFPSQAPTLVWRIIHAEVAELADAHGSGPCTRKGVGVRVPSSALYKRFNFNSLNPFLDVCCFWLAQSKLLKTNVLVLGYG